MVEMIISEFTGWYFKFEFQKTNYIKNTIAGTVHETSTENTFKNEYWSQTLCTMYMKSELANQSIYLMLFMIIQMEAPAEI